MFIEYFTCLKDIIGKIVEKRIEYNNLQYEIIRKLVEKQRIEEEIGLKEIQ